MDVTSSLDEAKSYQGPLFNYSNEKIRENEFWIVPQGLLGENSISPKDVVVKDNNGVPYFFETKGDYHFDVLAAVFYLLSRYEEYLPHGKDSYGRYAHTNSLAFRENFLHRPLINEWLKDLSAKISGRFSIHLNQPGFTFLPTYDIDIAYSYRYKGFWRNLGAGAADFARLKWGRLWERIAVCVGRKNDPFDVFGWLNSLHERYKLRPYYFFLFAKKRGRYDKNIDPLHPAMQRLAQDHAIRYPVGLHPSWRSGDEPGLIREEKELLSKATGLSVDASRQHYIRMDLPGTYRNLLAAGIRFDFSMGYGSINGFRASVALPFYWYDLEREQPTDLLLFPFCYMEANSYFEQGQDAQQGIEEMKNYYDAVKATGGIFCMIWHNSFLTEVGSWKKWRNGYENFLQDLANRY